MSGIDSGNITIVAALPATTVTDQTSFGLSKVVGVLATYAREDHSHGTPASPAPVPTRTNTIVSSATPTPNSDNTDIFTVTALAVAATFGAPTGNPINGQKLIIRIKDNGGAQNLSWNAIYRASTDIALPTTTTISKTMYLGFIYNSTDLKWDFVAFTQGF
jgi:hypothetical protein